MTHAWIDSEEIRVQIGTSEQPTLLHWRGRAHHVEHIEQQWEIHTDWWETHGAIWRAYFAIITADGMLCVIYRDLNGDTWHLAKMYD